MRLNVYSDELTDRVEVVNKTTSAGDFIGVRLFIETPITLKNQHGMKQVVRGPSEPVDGDDDSSAVTLWARTASPEVLLRALRTAVLLLEQRVAPRFSGG
jgi:hypothetical protein